MPGTPDDPGKSTPRTNRKTGRLEAPVGRRVPKLRRGKSKGHAKVVALTPKQVRELVKSFGGDLIGFEVIQSAPKTRLKKALEGGPRGSEETESGNERKTRIIVALAPSKPGSE